MPETLLLDYIESAVAASSIEELWELLCGRMDDYGFDRLIYGFTYNRRDNHLGDRRDMLILSSHPAPYTDHYIGGELFFDAPLTRWALTNHGLRSWSLIDTIRDELTPKQLEIVAFNRKHDVRAGATISFFEISSRRLAGVGLAARTDLSQQDVDEIIAEHGREILAINQVTDLKMKTLPFAAGNGPLTQRQREALECVGDGLTTAETAKRMGLTSATVEKHLRLAREALSVSTTAQAIMKASFQNQIYVVDDATIF